MNKIKTLAVALAACSISAAAWAQDAETDTPFIPEGYELTGETRSCLSARRIDKIDPVDRNAWLVTMRSGPDYVTRVSSGCRSATSNFTYLSYQLRGSQLCRGEIIRVVDRGSNMLAGSCGLGEFEELYQASDAEMESATE